MKKETYKTKHPTITEISKGDKFVTESGDIVEFKYCDHNDNSFPFKFNDGYWYTIGLKFLHKDINHAIDIKYKLPSIKDKLDLL